MDIKVQEPLYYIIFTHTFLNNFCYQSWPKPKQNQKQKPKKTKKPNIMTLKVFKTL